MAKKLTTKDFIEKAKMKHHNKYDYSISEYTGTFGFINIKCLKHGIFKQRANNHLNGQGCPQCGIDNTKNKQKNHNFIEKSKKIHKNKYDYSLVKYINNRTKVKLICTDCKNIIEQTPSNNLKGYDCPFCSERFFDINKFISNSNIIHKNKYDYSKVIYEKNKSKITIICPVHGEFKQRTVTI